MARDGRVLEASYLFADLTGYSRNDLIDSTLQNVINLIFKSNAGEIPLFIENQCTMESFLFTKSCQVRFVFIDIHQGATPNELIFIFTEKPYSRLEDRYPYLGQLCCTNYNGVAVYNVPGFILLKANNCYLDYLDEPFNAYENSIGHSADEIITNWADSKVRTLWKSVVNTGTVTSLKEAEYYSLRRGATYWDTIIIPIKEKDRIKFIVENVTEVTERVKNRISTEMHVSTISQKKLEIESSLKSKEEFFSFMSHEFRTPLTVIDAAIKTMEDIHGSKIHKHLRQYILLIKQNSRRLLRLVNNLLDITRIENGYMEVHKRNMDIVSFTRDITESVSLYAAEKGVNLSFKSLLNKKTIAVDREKYERVLLNLLSNAIKFTPVGKSVVVKLSSKNTSVYLDVIDEGIGIPKEKHKLIFERFEQVDNKLNLRMQGSGLGLCIVKLLVNAMGGGITVESEEGKGSRFTVMLHAEKLMDDKSIESTSPSNNEYISNAADVEFSILDIRVEQEADNNGK